MGVGFARAARLVPALIIGLHVAPAFAELDEQIAQSFANMVGTLSVSSQPYMSEGTLTGCTLLFDTLYQDFTYRNGGYLRVTGSVGLVKAKATLGASLKVVVLEIDPSKPDLGMTPSPPSRAYLQGSKLETNLPSLIESSTSDTPGALFSIFQLSPTIDLVMDGIDENLLTVAFNSRGGKTDIRLPIELDVIDFQADGSRVRSDKTTIDFSTCLLTLLDTFR